MGTDHWQPVRVKRLRSEPAFKYERRREEIVAIVNGFRSGHFHGSTAERLDERLQALMRGAIEVSEPPAAVRQTVRQSG
jgi:hypothetical protein